MDPNVACEELARILHQLTRLQKESSSVRVVARSHGAAPAQRQEETISFRSDEEPLPLSLEHETDQIVATIHGNLRAPEAAEDLAEKLRRFFQKTDLHEHWDVRANFAGKGPDHRGYSLTVFTVDSAGDHPAS